MKWNKNQLVIFLLIGILLIVIAIPGGEDTSEIKGGNDIESRLETVLGEIEGAGKVQVMITYQEEETVEGVAVIAEGAGNSVVIRNITEVVQALFDLETHKIKVIKGNSTN